MTEMATTALGCAVHSGWAVVVGVSLDGGADQKAAALLACLVLAAGRPEVG